MPRNLVIPVKELENVVAAICDAYDEGIDVGVDQSSYRHGLVCKYLKGSVEELAFMNGVTVGMGEDPIEHFEQGHDQISEAGTRYA